MTMKMMATMTFDLAQRTETVPLIPREQARIRELTQAGTVLALYIEASLRRVWLVLQGADETAIRQALESLPLYPYVINLDLVALAG
jgi:muconolactone delta-isomerase